MYLNWTWTGFGVGGLLSIKFDFHIRSLNPHSTNMTSSTKIRSPDLLASLHCDAPMAILISHTEVQDVATIPFFRMDIK